MKPREPELEVISAVHLLHWQDHLLLHNLLEILLCFHWGRCSSHSGTVFHIVKIFQISSVGRKGRKRREDPRDGSQRGCRGLPMAGKCSVYAEAGVREGMDVPLERGIRLRKWGVSINSLGSCSRSVYILVMLAYGLENAKNRGKRKR